MNFAWWRNYKSSFSKLENIKYRRNLFKFCQSAFQPLGIIDNISDIVWYCMCHFVYVPYRIHNNSINIVHTSTLPELTIFYDIARDIHAKNRALERSINFAQFGVVGTLNTVSPSFIFYHFFFHKLAMSIADFLYEYRRKTWAPVEYL